MKATQAPQIVTFDCNAAQFIFTAVFRNRKQIICPACQEEVTPCKLGALFNGEAYHKDITCLLAISDYLTGPQAGSIQTK